MLRTLLGLLSCSLFAQTVPQWTRWETTLTSTRSYENPVQDVRVAATLIAPSGRTHSTEAVWNGEQQWLLRWSPDEVGVWRWKTASTDSELSKTGQFTSGPYTGSNPLYRHGALRLSKDRYSIQHADGTPFFWLADTVWAGPMLAPASDWGKFLADRSSKRFTAIQFMGTQNIAAAADAQGRQAFGGREKIYIDPYFFRRLDERVNAINDAGLIASPTFLWAAEWHPSAKVLDPAAWLSDEQAILLGRYFTARYGAHQVVWMFAGDHDYRGPKAERWRKLGRAIFGEKPHRLVTMHPAPRALLKQEFGSEPWIGFLGYQSSHSSGDETVRWILQGEPATDWKTEPPLPVINIEPIYEAHMNFGKKQLASAFDVRQAVWWSLLVSPTAGVSYGGHGVWSWETQPAIPMNHYQTGVARPWQEAMQLPGSLHMKYVREFFDKVPWHQLRPAPQVLSEQTGDIQRFIAASQTTDGRFTVVYTPGAGTVDLKAPAGGTAEWFDPTSGRTVPATNWQTPGKNAAGDEDWVLLIRR